MTSENKEKRMINSNTTFSRILSLQQDGKILSLNQKILLAEMGTVEQILSILLDTEIVVKVLRQTEKDGYITRESILISKNTGKSLIFAESKIYIKNIPYFILEDIKKKEKGIGSIIYNKGLETLRDLVEIGWNINSNNPFRIYRIYYSNHVAFEIKEEILIQ